MQTTTAADAIAAGLASLGVRRMFGMPGGGSSLDLIVAAERQGIGFTLARQESGAMFMAAAAAEVSGRPSVVLVTRGPGVAAAVTGLAHADLDRCPVLLVSDGFTPDQRRYVTHQVIDHGAIAAPLVRGRAIAEGPDAAACLADLAAAMEGACRGPALLEITDEATKVQAAPATMAMPQLAAPPPETVEHARRLLAQARRPAIIAGLEAREAAAALRGLARSLGAPVFVTYKAKGVIGDEDGLFAGVFTGGAAEAALLAEADLILLAGADPVEFIPQRWRYPAPVIDIARFRRSPHYVSPAAELIGDIGASLAALAAAARQGDWGAGRIAEAVSAWRGALATRANGPRPAPSDVVTIAAEAARAASINPRVTVDAGAHMFSATSFWPAQEPNDLLISNGLATMGFALPAAIGAALAEPGRRTVAFTGDGGLLMCLGEIATAVENRLPIVVVVFNDGRLSLIELKKAGRPVPDQSLGWAHPGFAAVARGLGCRGATVETAEACRAALDEAFAQDGPCVIDVRIDPSAYPAQIAAIRG